MGPAGRRGVVTAQNRLILTAGLRGGYVKLRLGRRKPRIYGKNDADTEPEYGIFPM
jgi:hypothetical protein